LVLPNAHTTTGHPQSLALQILGIIEQPFGHWYMLSINMVAKRFEILDSLRGSLNEEMIDHASQLVEAIKTMYHVNYSDSHRQIDEYELMYVPVPRQTTGLVGFSYFPYYASAFLCFVIVEVGLVYELPFFPFF
jgi:hypothetical protein